MTTRFKLPLGQAWLSTLSRWAAELRNYTFLLDTDPVDQEWDLKVPVSTGGGPVTIQAPFYSKYYRLGKLVFLDARVTIQVGPSAASFFFLRLPQPLSIKTQRTYLSGWTTSTIKTLLCIADYQGQWLEVYMDDFTNFAANTQYTLFIKGFYYSDQPTDRPQTT